MDHSLAVPSPIPVPNRAANPDLDRPSSVANAQRSSLPPASKALCIASCACFVLLLLVVLFHIRHLNEGHLVYALDDPYIHLSLSEQIAHGHYGLNPTEYSAPASSILWPLLLAPFAPFAIHPYMPLLLNIVFGVLAVYLLAKFVARWLPRLPGNAVASWTVQLLTVVLLTFAANLVSLPFVGMEHVLQVLLAIACAYGMSLAWDGEPIPWWSMAAAAIIPLVRYESILLTLAMVVTLVATRRLLAAAFVFLGALIPLVSFSLFLHHLGLQWLPSSVLIKFGHRVASSSAFGKLHELLRMTYHGALDDPTRWPVIVLFVLLALLLIKKRSPIARVILGASVMVGVVHLMVGGFGWFHRYEIYAVIFLALMLLRAMAEEEPQARTSLLLGLFLLAAPYGNAALQTPDATHEIYRQQVQMRRFLDDYYRKDVAVNDIGLTSYRRPPGVFILDLWGLSWYEAGIANRTPEWLQTTVAHRNIGLAMLYPKQFTPPSSWKVVGEMCLGVKEPIVAGGDCVDFYGTTPESSVELERELRQFAPTLPAGSKFTFGPPQAVTQH